MVAGLQIINDYGTTQIDQDWRNFGFRQKFSVGFTLSPALPGQTAAPQNYSLPLTGVACMVAAKSDVLCPVPYASNLSGSSWTFDFRIFPPPTPTPGVSYSGTVEFYVFDVPWAGGFSNVGLEVFDAIGQRVYHSDMDVMRVPSGGVQNCAADFFGESGRVYAPLVLRNPIRSYYNGVQYFLYTRTLRSIGSNIITGDQPVEAGSFLEENNYGLYAAVDVTGLS